MEKVTKIFSRRAQENTAVAEVSLTIPTGTRLGIVGESGSGKTTLIKMLACLSRPTTGGIWFEGKSIIGLEEKQLGWVRRGVQMVFQDPRSSLDPRMTIGRSITEPLRSRFFRQRVSREEAEQRLAEVLQQVGLEIGAAKRYPHQFSGGQRQRIAIARAVITKPKVLIADEPVSALDVSVRAQVLNLLNDLVRQSGMTMLFVSHDLSVVRYLCNQVLVLKSGKLVESGSVAQIYDNPQHPYTQRLIKSLPRLPR